MLFSYFSMQNLDCSSNVIFYLFFLYALLVSYLFFFCFISFLKPFLLLSWYYTLYFVKWLIFLSYFICIHAFEFGILSECIDFSLSFQLLFLFSSFYFQHIKKHVAIYFIKLNFVYHRLFPLLVLTHNALRSYISKTSIGALLRYMTKRLCYILIL